MANEMCTLKNNVFVFVYKNDDVLRKLNYYLYCSSFNFIEDKFFISPRIKACV